MPLKIQNYGDWKGDSRRGHHPPACTCFRCNEERRRLEASKEEERRVAEYDRRVAESQRRPQSSRNTGEAAKPNRPGGGQSRPRTTSQRRAAEAVGRSVAGARPAATENTASRRPGSPRKQSKVFRMSRGITASALRYSLYLHSAAILGVIGFALVQGGGANVMPTLYSAAEAYVQGWSAMVTALGL